MAITWERSDSQGIIRITASSPCHLHDGLEIIQELRSALITAPASGILADLRDLKAVLEIDEVGQVSSSLFHLKNIFNVPIALLVKGKIWFGFAEMFSMQVRMFGLNTEVFVTEDDALDWLYRVRVSQIPDPLFAQEIA